MSGERGDSPPQTPIGSRSCMSSINSVEGSSRGGQYRSGTDGERSLGPRVKKEVKEYICPQVKARVDRGNQLGEGSRPESKDLRKKLNRKDGLNLVPVGLQDYKTRRGREPRLGPLGL